MSTLRGKVEYHFSKSMCFTVVVSDLFTTLWGINFEMLILPFVFEGHFSKNICFFSQATPRYRMQARTPDRVLYHMEVRTLYARRMFREKLKMELS